jgi:hypothetical protein
VRIAAREIEFPRAVTAVIRETFTKATISKTKKLDTKARTEPQLLKEFDFLLRRSSRCLPTIVTQINFGGHCPMPEDAAIGG